MERGGNSFGTSPKCHRELALPPGESPDHRRGGQRTPGRDGFGAQPLRQCVDVYFFRGHDAESDRARQDRAKRFGKPLEVEAAGIRAASSDTSPTPQPISRTCMPAASPARRKRCSVNGFKIEACRASRRCSRSSWPITYADLGNTVTVYHCKCCPLPHDGTSREASGVY